MQELILKLDDVAIEILKRDVNLREGHKAFGDILLHRILDAYQQNMMVISIQSKNNTPLTIRTFKQNKPNNHDNSNPIRTQN